MSQFHFDFDLHGVTSLLGSPDDSDNEKSSIGQNDDMSTDIADSGEETSTPRAQKQQNLPC